MARTPSHGAVLVTCPGPAAVAAWRRWRLRGESGSPRAAGCRCTTAASFVFIASSWDGHDSSPRTANTTDTSFVSADNLASARPARLSAPDLWAVYSVALHRVTTRGWSSSCSSTWACVRVFVRKTRFMLDVCRVIDLFINQSSKAKQQRLAMFVPLQSKNIFVTIRHHHAFIV